LVSSAKLLDDAYRTEHNGDVRERLLLVRRVLVDNEQTAALLRWDSVQEAYIQQSGPDPVVNPTDDPKSKEQGYLDLAPGGIDAKYAWKFTGGDGAGQRFIDLNKLILARKHSV
jgi:hypothetical protein